MARTTPSLKDDDSIEGPDYAADGRRRNILRSGIDRLAGVTRLSDALGSRRLRSLGRLVYAVLLLALGALAWASGVLQSIWELREDVIYLTFGELDQTVDFLTGDFSASLQHIPLVIVSGTLAILVGIPFGIQLSRPYMERYAEALMQVLNVGTTIPTLAILALSMSVLGIGSLPAVFGLFVATLLPIVRNAYAGMTSVPAHLIESATGMGMTQRQIMRQVEVPNALFVMFAGIRTALAINVGTVPLAFLIGGGGLGELIFQGIALNDFGMMLAGAIPVALLAVLVDFLLAQAQLWLVPRGVNPLR
jgi:osmoprotectant transport system permease protein